jgi:hypothetical protein
MPADQKVGRPGRSGRDVSPLALDAAAAASRHARATAQVRRGFVRRVEPQDGQVPPLARMLRGGRGGHVRVKLFLTLIWMQRDLEQAVPVAFPAQSFARLFDLPNPETAGVRRIQDAQAWLARNRFISIEPQRGLPNRVYPLSELGTGQTYVPAGRVAQELAGTPEAAPHLYLQVPRGFWINGYMAALSGAAVAMYLVLLDQLGIGDARNKVWFSPRIASNLYDLSQDTRTKGLRELQNYGIIKVTRRPVEPMDFHIERMRNVYTLLSDVITTRIAEPVDASNSASATSNNSSTRARMLADYAEK